MRLGFLSLLIALTLGCATTREGPRLSNLPLRVQTFVADDEGLAASSHLIRGETDCLLVDAQLTRSHARKLLAMVEETGCSLETIFITHAHPDHYLGLEVLTGKFPRARVLALPGVIAAIQARSATQIAYWKPHYRGNLADRAVVPDPLPREGLSVEGESVQVFPVAGAESEHAAILYLPSIQVLVAGDLIYNQVHPWIGENRPEGWLQALKGLQRFGVPGMVLGGHGPASDAGVIAANERYLKAFLALTDGKTSSSAASRKLQEMFPKHRLPIFAETSVAMRLKVPSRSSPKSPQNSH
jgi:glyoxylase-like metal-dependent hydrolase (beta-lactamase superfamily II)